MKFLATGIEGAHLIELEPHADERGFFARSWSRQEFQSRGLNADLSECSVSFNRLRGTLRGMHYQIAPHEEAKVVMCMRGLIYDVIVDLRKSSASHLKWFATELSLDKGRLLYVPEGVAHGFLTLDNDSYVQYQIGASYAPEAARGVRWNDPLLNLQWPEPPTVISERDRGFEDYRP
jgi:dTDP-4-dehydrorhamnose 3,5-epimerase